MPSTTEFSIFGAYTPPGQPLRTVKRMLTCNRDLGGCGTEFPYKHGRPPELCPPCTASRANRIAEEATQRGRERQEEKRRARAGLPTPSQIVAFLQRSGVASHTNRDGWNQVLTPWGTFDTYRELPQNVAAALAAERQAA